MGIKNRKNRERRQREQLILAAAKKVVAANGFRKTTICQIAHEAELSPGTIYLYFKNKEELFSSLVLHPLQFIELSIRDVWRIHRNADFESKINALHKVLIDAYRFDPLIIANMFHLLSVEKLDCMTPPVFSQVKQLFQKIQRHLVILFDDDKLKMKSIDQLKGMENLFFVLLSGIAVWSGIRNQLFEDDAVGDYSGSCDVAVDLFLQVSKTTFSRSSFDYTN
jgi:AcrR family transcriptional regulator